MFLMKIDNNGNYLPFPGLTIVSSIQEVDRFFWNLIDDVVRQHPYFTQYFSPLPCDSYHMTTTHLFNQMTIGENKWKEFIDINKIFFQSLIDELRQNAFHPVISIESIHLDGVLQLMVSLPREQNTIIENIAAKYGLQHKVPDVFHITLAYQYKYLPPIQLDSLSIELNQKIGTIFNTHQVELNFNPPTLCYFNDMTKFIPWDGLEYPYPEDEYLSKLTF